MTTRRTIDVAALPEYAFGHQGLIWWGTIGFMVIEGSMFVMVAITYFVFRTRMAEWPPAVANPSVFWGTVNTIVMVVSVVPNHLAKKAAEEFQLTRVRILLPICVAFAVAFLVVRVLEFGSLNCTWQTFAYGSITWFVLGLHTTHLITETLETAVVTALMFTDHVEPKRFVDVSENCGYWYFVVAIWIPIYLLIYFGPRWL